MSPYIIFNLSIDAELLFMRILKLLLIDLFTEITVRDICKR